MKIAAHFSGQEIGSSARCLFYCALLTCSTLFFSVDLSAGYNPRVVEVTRDKYVVAHGADDDIKIDVRWLDGNEDFADAELEIRRKIDKVGDPDNATVVDETVTPDEGPEYVWQTEDQEPGKYNFYVRDSDNSDWVNTEHGSWIVDVQLERILPHAGLPDGVLCSNCVSDGYKFYRSKVMISPPQWRGVVRIPDPWGGDGDWVPPLLYWDEDGSDGTVINGDSLAQVVGHEDVVKAVVYRRDVYGDCVITARPKQCDDITDEETVAVFRFEFKLDNVLRSLGSYAPLLNMEQIARVTEVLDSEGNPDLGYSPALGGGTKDEEGTVKQGFFWVATRPGEVFTGDVRFTTSLAMYFTARHHLKRDARGFLAENIPAVSVGIPNLGFSFTAPGSDFGCSSSVFGGVLVHGDAHGNESEQFQQNTYENHFPNDWDRRKIVRVGKKDKEVSRQVAVNAEEAEKIKVHAVLKAVARAQPVHNHASEARVSNFYLKINSTVDLNSGDNEADDDHRFDRKEPEFLIVSTGE